MPRHTKTNGPEPSCVESAAALMEELGEGAPVTETLASLGLESVLTLVSLALYLQHAPLEEAACSHAAEWRRCILRRMSI